MIEVGVIGRELSLKRMPFSGIREWIRSYIGGCPATQRSNRPRAREQVIRIVVAQRPSRS